MNLATVNNVVTMSSREIAALTGKGHFHVVRDIKSLQNQLGDMFTGSIQNWIHPQNKQKYEEYLLDKDTCLTLLLGYDAVARMRVVKRWQELEQQTTKASLPDFTNPVVAARAWADEVEGRLIAEKSLEEAQPAIEFYDNVGRSASLVRIGDAAKSFGFGRNKFFKFLREKKIMQKDINIPYQRFIEAGMFEVKYQSYIDEGGAPQVRPVTFITGKGLTYIHKVIDG